MRKQRQADFYNMPVFAFCGAILLVSMRAWNMMCNSNALKKELSFWYSPPPVSLHSKNFAIKELFNKSLKFMKTLKNFALVAQQIDPSELAEIINKTHIISISSNSWESRAPNIGENKF